MSFLASSQAYLNGCWIPAAEATISLYDTGFVQGVTVAEQLRTFAGQLYRLEQHLERLRRSLDVIGVRLPVEMPELAALALEAVRRNHPLLAEGDDLGVTILATPGAYAGFAPGSVATTPTLCIHTQPVAFHQFAGRFETGQALATTPIRQVPADCWPVELKCRSRMHYYLADRAARQIDPDARALMLDHSEAVTEASTANLVAYYADQGLVSPPREKILPGVSVAVLADLASSLGFAFSYRDLSVDDVARADELFLTSTSPCMIPGVRLNGRPIGDGRPGPTFRRLIAAWSEKVGVDIVAQAQRFAVRA